MTKIFYRLGKWVPESESMMYKWEKQVKKGRARNEKLKHIYAAVYHEFLEAVSRRMIIKGIRF